ncbi:cysteine desulfurase [Raineyella antarctica]|uniref:Cysteine desulfurase n=1 Tax=Raineyella antarctica TaxID=1577474 RepID=A0A1G6GCN9_9ACTN|nr:hypothetical protein [Raineyella antarctica]SDB79740.1 cysteine desulfurase [Raineyella antarctica]
MAQGAAGAHLTMMRMDVPTDRAMSAVRLPLGRWTTASDVEQAAHLLTTWVESA